ncbi:tryptophanase [Mycobacterium intracellulare]|uniref:tryptophanase n=1 Tax=Mycobacterium intracellulare TaxID=1767 RepID=UPI000A8A7CCA|nr:tryptophanase [Mycobacterium intracellulare]
MVHDEELKLAWALAGFAEPYLNTVERTNIHVRIGVGETFSAICSLITRIVREGAPLPADLVAALTDWLHGYAGTEDEPRLRELIDHMKSAVRHTPTTPSERDYRWG